ncbi:TPA: hypothetical protein ACH3X2_008278 [Trebouxia sp. C0005]
MTDLLCHMLALHFLQAAHPTDHVPAGSPSTAQWCLRGCWTALGGPWHCGEVPPSSTEARELCDSAPPAAPPKSTGVKGPSDSALLQAGYSRAVETMGLSYSTLLEAPSPAKQSW